MQSRAKTRSLRGGKRGEKKKKKLHTHGLETKQKPIGRLWIHLAPKKPTTPGRYRCGLRMAEGFNHSEPIDATAGSIGCKRNEHTTGASKSLLIANTCIGMEKKR